MYYYPPYRNNYMSNKRMNIISVFGEGRVSVQPNMAKVTLGASTEAMDVTQAQNNNSIIIARIKEALKKLGVPEQQIQTVDYSIFPQYDYKDGEQIFRGYKVQHLLLVTIEHIENTGIVIDTAVSNGANIVSGIQFTTKDADQFVQQALSLAVVNSFQKAETIAGTLGVKLIKTPIQVIENIHQQGAPIPFQATAFAKSEVATPIQPGTIEFKSYITAEYIYS
ncbi:SIMPL domain-containing protein [Cytobacillus solani]|uniref:SIMPL domain-containing protein n=2 Tax=Cytobacillus solani TaxID=1637975 RepID=UPI001BA91FBC|nr:SIMPL domain-containing protein [Cytobacillus solani]